jgi:hypothetical protein
MSSIRCQPHYAGLFSFNHRRQLDQGGFESAENVILEVVEDE